MCLIGLMEIPYWLLDLMVSLLCWYELGEDIVCSWPWFYWPFFRWHSIIQDSPQHAFRSLFWFLLSCCLAQGTSAARHNVMAPVSGWIPQLHPGPNRMQKLRLLKLKLKHCQSPPWSVERSPVQQQVKVLDLSTAWSTKGAEAMEWWVPWVIWWLMWQEWRPSALQARQLSENDGQVILLQYAEEHWVNKSAIIFLCICWTWSNYCRYFVIHRYSKP